MRPEDLLDDDDKGKVSRWQIGSTSLNVLEQVYQMEPFPGDCACLRRGAIIRGSAWGSSCPPQRFAAPPSARGRAAFRCSAGRAPEFIA